MSDEALYVIVAWAGALVAVGSAVRSRYHVRNARRGWADELRTVARLADFLARSGEERPGTGAVTRLRPGFDWTVGGKYPPQDPGPGGCA